MPLFKICIWGVGKTAQQLRTPAVFLEDSGSVPSTHINSRLSVTPAPEDPMASFGLLGYCMYVVHRHHAGKIPTSIKIKLERIILCLTMYMYLVCRAYSLLLLLLLFLSLLPVYPFVSLNTSILYVTHVPRDCIKSLNHE